MAFNLKTSAAGKKIPNFFYLLTLALYSGKRTRFILPKIT
jgi:hypothetical protein